MIDVQFWTKSHGYCCNRSLSHDLGRGCWGLTTPSVVIVHAWSLHLLTPYENTLSTYSVNGQLHFQTGSTWSGSLQSRLLVSYAHAPILSWNPAMFPAPSVTEFWQTHVLSGAIGSLSSKKKKKSFWTCTLRKKMVHLRTLFELFFFFVPWEHQLA